jgi:hypothetical protein
MSKTPIPCRITRSLLAVLFSISLLAAVGAPAFARQNSDGGSVVSFAPDLSQFPTIGFYFGVYDASGNFINDLTNPDIQLLENGHSVTITELTKVQPGIQTIVAVTPSLIMGSRLTNTTTGYDVIRNALVQWAQSLKAGTPDDFSFSVPGGLQIVREKDPARLAQALQAYQPDFKPQQVNLVSLTQAIDLGTDPNPNTYMKRSILYVTALPSQDMLNSIPNLTSRAMQLGIRISIWLVAPPKDTGVQQSAAPLIEMARKTGGSFFIFTGSEALPDYNTDLASLRYLYHLSYNSVAKMGGEQTLGIHVGRPGLEINGTPLKYKLTIAPPNPMFLAPPAQIKRVLVPNQSRLVTEPQYDTKDVVLKALIEFPDGHPRQIKASRLYVDDKLVVENTRPPFDQFRWNLEAYTDSSSHMLRIEVEDVLGSVNTSINVPVDVVVDQPPGFSLSRLIPVPLKGAGLAILISLFVAGIVLLIVLLVPGIRSRFGRLSPKKTQIERDPLTQPVKIYQERVSAATHSPTVPRSLTGLSAPARLVRLSEGGHPLPASAILLNRREIVIGSDSAQATCLIEDPSVSKVHARLIYADGAFMIADANSVAGTWINYTPVSSLGVQLEHGDMIHIGRVAFRFELSVPPEPKKPRVVLL